MTMKQEFTIDLKGVRATSTLHRKLATALPLPADYGRNFDAFYDVLTEYGANWKITFVNATAAPEPLRAVCADAQAETPGLEIVFA